MAEYISFQPSDFFNPVLYTGTEAELAVTGAGFQPDLVWLKCREATESQLWFDSVRGATKYLESNATTAATTNAESLKSFDSDGFTLGTMVGSNKSGNNYASWNWKAGTTSGIAGSPSITPASYSFNQTSGFSILTYEGSGATATLPHGLGVAPDLIITKEIEPPGGGNDWGVYHSALGNTKAMWLNTTAAAGTNSSYWNDTSPTSTLFTVSTNTQSNGSSTDYVAYCFANKKGYSKFGSYTGSGHANGPFVYTGFRPAFIVIKNADAVETWNLWDSRRSPFNLTNLNLRPNNNTVENTASAPGGQVMDILSNGFKIRGTTSETNQSTKTMVYWAFAESPIVSSNDVPTVAR